MQQAVIYSRAKAAQADNSKSHNNEEEQEVNLLSERAKYKNFWIGVNRGILIDSKNPKIVEETGKRTIAVEKARGKNLFMPAGRYKLIWDGVITGLIIYSIVMIPVRISFEPQMTFGTETFEDVIMLFFFLDILATFNTAYIDDGTEVLIMNRTDIAMNYLKLWFWIDVLSTIPFDNLANYVSNGGNNLPALRAVRALRLFRILKLFRISKFNETLENMRINPQIINLAVLMLSIFFIAHVLACGWHFMALYQENRGNDHTWVNVLGFTDASIYDKYVVSLYYVMVTMMTIGYGDIRPVTSNERIFAIGTMLTGGVIFGAMISRLASILEKRNPEAKAMAQNMSELKSFLVDVKLPIEARKRAVSAYFYYLSKKSAFGEPSFLEQLPQPIMYRVVKQMCETDIRSVRLFRTYEMDFVVPLLLVIKPFQAAAGDVIFSEGDMCDCIVFLKKGKVAISSNNGYTNVLAGYVRSGGYFGDFEYLRKTTCIATYSASKNSDLLSVPHSQINYASAKCLDGGVRFKKENEIRYSLFNQVLKQNKRDADQFVTQKNYTFEESRAIVDKLLGRQRGGISPRRSTVSAGAKTPRRTLTPAQRIVKSLWVDGVIVGARNLNLLAKSTETPLPMDLDENMVRVIYVNPHGRVAPGEVSESYIQRQGIIHPMHPYKVAWDLIILVLVLFSIITVPVETAFREPMFEHSNTVSQVTDGFFLTDVVLTFRTAFYEDNGDHLVILPSLIAKQYVTGWFLPDLAGSLPIGAIVDAFYDSSTNLTFTKLLKIIRLVRLFKIMRLMKLGYLTEILEDRLGLSPAAMSLLMMLLQVFFVGHLVACVLYGVSAWIVRDPWWANDVPTVHPPLGSASLSSKYITSLYWTFTIMSTVGYGDIYPQTTPERILNIFVILLGASMFGYMIANVSGLIQSLNSSDAVMKDKISTITEFLDEKQCPHKLQDSVIKHFRNYYKHASPFDVDTILARLPNHLANEIRLIHHDNTLKHIAVLKYIDNISIRLYVFNLMKPVYYEPNEPILREGSPGTEIFFLTEGKAVAFKKTGAQKKKEAAASRKEKSAKGSPLPSSPSQRLRQTAGAALRRMSSLMAPIFGAQQDDGGGDGENNRADQQSRSYSPNGQIAASRGTPDKVQEPETRTSTRSRSPSPIAAVADGPVRMAAETLSTPPSKGAQFAPGKAVNNSPFSGAKSDGGRASPAVGNTPFYSPVDATAVVHELYAGAQAAVDALQALPALAAQSFPFATPPAEDKNKVVRTFMDEMAANEQHFNDMEPTMESPPPPLPHRLQRFQFSQHLQIPEFDDSDSEFDEEFEQLRAKHSPINSRREDGDEAAVGQTGDFPAPALATLTFGGKQGSMKRMEDSNRFEDSDSDASDVEVDVDGAAHKFDPSFVWTEETLAKNGLTLVGEISPGDFVGHLSLMHESTNLVSVVTAAFSTVYTLHKQDIVPLVSKQPTVAMQLQMALSRAVSAQADMLGKLHMRQKRSKFLVRTKERFYQKLGVLPREVKRIRVAMKNKVKRMAKNVKSKVVTSKEKSTKMSDKKVPFYISSGASATLHAVFTTDSNDMEEDDRYVSVKQKSETGFELRRLESTTHMAKEALAAQVRRLPRSTVRKVKAVERVLTKYSVVYDSEPEAAEDEDVMMKSEGSGIVQKSGKGSRKLKVQAHRTPLPPTVALRVVAAQPPPAPAMKRRRSTLLAQTLESPSGVGRVFLQRVMSRNAVEAADKGKKLQRVVSFNDLETLDPPAELSKYRSTDAAHTRSDLAALQDDPSLRVVPIFANHCALGHEADLRGRRQSFPSLDNDLWKVNNTSQGLL